MSEAEHKTLSPKRNEPDTTVAAAAAPELHHQQQQQQLLLHQTTQSLLMASSMLCAAQPPQPAQPQMKINVEDLLRENSLLHAKLKEVSIERDRLLCEVSNLRLELDMFELKRLPLELDEG